MDFYLYLARAYDKGLDVGRWLRRDQRNKSVEREANARQKEKTDTQGIPGG
jgi:hypothetical protein